MAKQQLNARVSDLTRRQLDELGQRWGTSQTETLTVIIDRMYQQETKTMTSHYVNQEVPIHPKPDYFSDPITRLAYDVYVAAYQPYGEANPDRVAVIEEWLRAGNLDDNPNASDLAAEWLVLQEE